MEGLEMQNNDILEVPEFPSAWTEDLRRTKVIDVFADVLGAPSAVTNRLENDPELCEGVEAVIDAVLARLHAAGRTAHYERIVRREHLGRSV